MCRSRERPLLMWARRGVVEEAMCEDRRLRQRMSGSSHYVLRAVAPRPRWSLTGSGWGRRHRVRRNFQSGPQDFTRNSRGATAFLGFGMSAVVHFESQLPHSSPPPPILPRPVPPQAPIRVTPPARSSPYHPLPRDVRATAALEPSQAPQPHRPVPAAPVSCDGCSMLPAPAWAPAAAAATAPHGQLRR